MTVFSSKPFSYPRLGLGLGLALVLALGGCTEDKPKNIPAPTPPAPVAPVTNEEGRDYSQYSELIWSDEFNDAALDQSKWTYELGNNNGWGNNELQSYTNSADNTFLTGGNLVIEARKSGGSYTSARLITKGKQSFQFGRMDIRARIPKGKGVWPAIWMLGSNIDALNWPKCGEIDIMELRGSKPTELLSTMHFANSAGGHEFQGKTAVQPFDLSTDFHTFSVVRSKNSTRFYLDGATQPYYSFESTSATPFPFNNPFFMILNLAVGGDFDGNPTADTVFPQRLQVDYVRFYQYK